MVNVKQNWGMKDAACPLCKKADDTQYHLLTRPTINKESWTMEHSKCYRGTTREVLLEQEQNEQQKQNQSTVNLK